MADVREELIFDLKIDRGASEKEVDALTKKISDLTKANKELAKANADLAKAGKDSSAEFIENAKQIEVNKNELAKNQAARKGLIQTITSEIGSINELRARNAELIKQRNDINIKTEEGRKKLDALNKEIDENNDLIKENVSTLEQQKINIGNYQGAIDGLLPGLGSFVGRINALEGNMKSLTAVPAGNFFKGLTAGIWGAVRAALAFIATGIGAVIAAVGLAVVALTSYFKGSEEGQNSWNRIMNVASVLLGKLTTIITDLGKVIFENLGKALSFAIDQLDSFAQFLGINTQGVKDFVNEIVNAANEVSSLQEFNKELERGLILQREVQNAKIAELKLREEDKSLDIRERIKAAQDAQKAIKALSDLEVLLAENRLKEAQLQAAQAPNDEAANTRLVELQAELFKIRKAASDQLREQFTKEQSLRQEAITQEEARLKRIAEISEEEREIRIATLERRFDEERELYLQQQEFYNEFYKGIDDAADASADNVKKNLAKTVKAQNDALKKQQEQKKKEVEIARLAERTKLQLTADGLAQAASLFKENTIAYKVLASAQALINTYLSATAAYASAGNPILGAILAAIAVAAGLANVAKINAVQFRQGGEVSRGTGSVFSKTPVDKSRGPVRRFARGGEFHTIGGNRHEQGGTKFYGDDGTQFEAERDEGIFILKREAHRDFISGLSGLNERHGGIGFDQKTSYAALGGQIASQQVSATPSAGDFARIVADSLSELPPVFVTVEDINAGQSRVAETERRAVVVK